MMASDARTVRVEVVPSSKPGVVEVVTVNPAGVYVVEFCRENATTRAEAE
jgi:hypothetical protein